MSTGDAEKLRIGQVAELTGTTPRTIRYYEEIGLLPAGRGREPGAHRLYQQDDVERLSELLRLRDLLGVSLEELKELDAAERARALLRREWRAGVDDPVRRREILEQAIGHIEDELALVRHRRDEIRKLESELTQTRRRLRGRMRELERQGAGT